MPRFCEKLCLLFIAIAAIASCEHKPQKPEVVLYTSCDDYLLRDITPLFEKETGIAVRVVGDTEATKTMGLVQRLIAERDHPRCDVWWSNEPMGTIRLAQEGLLAPSEPRALREEFGGTWPLGLADKTWYGFALRERAIVYNTARLTSQQAPRSLGELTDPKWKNRIGMARPQFGTTQGHMAYLASMCGEQQFRTWLAALKANGVRLYDGNSAVVRAASQGEIDVGLTDTDDIIAGKREKWPVDRAVESPGGDSTGLCGCAPMSIPNTVGVVKGAPHPNEAAALLDFLVSAKVERLLAESESSNLPIRPALAAELAARLSFTTATPMDWPKIQRALPAAMKACDEVLGG